MNQLFISKRTIHKSLNLITSIDSYFNTLILTKELKLNDNDIKFMEVIDKSKLSKDIGYIDTPFGSHVSMFYMSTGLKTLILVNHSKESDVIDISQCGQNVINILFNSFNNKRYYASFCIIPDTLRIPLKINNRKEICKDKMDLFKVWEERYGA